MACNQNESRIFIDFSPDQSCMTRVGDDLIFLFEDESSVVLAKFYNACTKDALPDFEIDSTLLSGEDFFPGFNVGLLPAGAAIECGTLRDAMCRYAGGPSGTNEADNLDSLNIRFDTATLEHGRLRIMPDAELDAALAALPGHKARCAAKVSAAQE